MPFSLSKNISFTQIGVQADLTGNGNLKFLVYSAPDNNPSNATLIFQSAPKFFTDNGLSVKLSDSFSPVTLQAGSNIRYYVGAIADVQKNYGMFLNDLTQNDIASFRNNANVTDFNNPTLATSLFGGNIGIQLFGDRQVIPEPLTILGSGLVLTSLPILKKARQKKN